MHGGLKSRAYFYGRKPLGGAARLFLEGSFLGTGFYF